VAPDCVSYIDAGRIKRGYEPSQANTWSRQYVKGDQWLRSRGNEFLRTCKSAGVDPSSLTGVDVSQYITARYNDGGFKSAASAIMTMLRLAHGSGVQIDRYDPDIEVVRKTGAQGAKLRRSEKRIPDIGPIWTELERMSLSPMSNATVLEGYAVTMAISGAFRPSDIARVPLYDFRRDPAKASLVQAKRIYVKVVGSKEELLRTDGKDWSDEVEIAQDLFDLAPWSYPGFWMEELSLRIRGKTKKAFMFHGRLVWSESFFVSRSGTGKLTTKPASSDTVSNAIQRVFDRAAAPQCFSPKDLRSTYATIFYHALVATQTVSMRVLLAQMRHRDDSTTKTYYRRDAIPEEWARAIEHVSSLVMTIEIALRARISVFGSL